MIHLSKIFVIVQLFFGFLFANNTFASGNPIEDLATKAPFKTNTESPQPMSISKEVISILESKKRKGDTNHLCFLIEYGLRVHWHYLKYTGLARELPLDTNLMLAELIRITAIPKYKTAHQAGWLNNQFYGEFNQTGWSSYQIYLYVKENAKGIFSDDKQFPNWQRRGDLVRIIDESSLNGVGGNGSNYYGSRIIPGTRYDTPFPRQN